MKEFGMKGFGKMFKMPRLTTGINTARMAGIKRSDLGLDLTKDMMPKVTITIKFKDV
jgi:hypothetical protein